MTFPLLSPRDILPHGDGLQLLKCAGQPHEDHWEFITSIPPESSVLSSSGRADAEVGLEIMAQAAGVTLAQKRQSDGNTNYVTRGVVGAVRGYDYSITPFTSEQSIKVTVKVDMCDETVGICECQLFIDNEKAPRQQARITIILSEESVEV
jgi:predicted hotdog family 3-hydroxylacyl-ACP dehydratase